MSNAKNLIVLGAGPGGYAAAFLAADLGMNVTLIGKEENPGGVCLYKGCIPSKAYLHVAKLIAEAEQAKNFGVTFSKPKIDPKKLTAYKNKVVKNLTGGLGQLSRQRKINYIKGEAKFTGNNEIEVVSGGAMRKLTFENIIIAAGSHPATIPGFNESKDILDSTTALDIDRIPKSMLVIGGGYIGLELGSVYASIGTKVSVVEMLPYILNGADRDLVAILTKNISGKFDEIMTNTRVAGVNKEKSVLKVTFESKDGKRNIKQYEKILVSVGRKPNSQFIGIENTGIETDNKGFIKVNEQQATSVKGIYAIGDICGEPMLAHKASHEARVAVEVIAGNKAAFEPACIPAVVFTDPEIAWAGLTQDQAKQNGIEIEVVKFPWAASGRAMSIDRTDGLTKIIIDPKTERLLGVGIAGYGAGELISEAVLAIEMGATATDIKMSIHPHPTLSETFMEAAEIFFGQSTHIYRPKKK